MTFAEQKQAYMALAKDNLVLFNAIMKQYSKSTNPNSLIYCFATYIEDTELMDRFLKWFYTAKGLTELRVMARRLDLNWEEEIIQVEGLLEKRALLEQNNVLPYSDERVSVLGCDYTYNRVLRYTWSFKE